MKFEESDEHSFPLAIVLNIGSLFMYCPQSSHCTMVLRSTLSYNKTLWITQKETCVCGAQARPTSHLSHAKRHENNVPGSEHFFVNTG